MANTAIFIIESIALFLIAKLSIRKLFDVFGSNLLVTIIFFPGTVLHEMSHFLFATALFLKVRGMSIFPQKHGNSIRLGSVSYVRQDFFRGIIVGMAPFLVGLAFFVFLSFFKIFPSENWMTNILWGYLVFAVSTTMFSSKQDMIDFIYIIPLMIIFGGVIYIFNIDITPFIFNNQLLQVIETINYYLFLSILINILVILLLKIIQPLFRK